MPIEKIEEGKMVITGGKGDFTWATAFDEIDGRKPGDDVAPEYIVASTTDDIKPSHTNRKDLANTVDEDWDLKIYLPTKDSFRALYSIMQKYGKEKWGEIPKLRH